MVNAANALLSLQPSSQDLNKPDQSAGAATASGAVKHKAILNKSFFMMMLR
ncbi:hypothetical protein [Moraxella lacunata]|uniref:hypothetical protein n=1 Tax=Moraxella lacunata TaxID=477 RepID=UPI0015F1B796|nr:hypothetical protein [Moraxella lacunata]